MSARTNICCVRWSLTGKKTTNSVALLLTTKALFETHQEALGLEWVAGYSGVSRAVDLEKCKEEGDTLFGHMNIIQPNHVQVLGDHELTYLNRLSNSARKGQIRSLFSLLPMSIVIADQAEVPPDIQAAADENDLPLLTSSVSCRKLINYLQEYYAIAVAEKQVLHGVFMEVKGLGLLLTGKSSVGKSELALELLSRGHRIIADDAPEFFRVAADTIRGRCPSLLQDFLEVRGLGILNVRALFGDSAIKQDKNLRLVIHLKEMSETEIQQIDRLEGDRVGRVILDVEIPEITIPVASGRNLAVLVESAASQHILRSKGYHAEQEFIRRHTEQIAKGSL